MQIMVDVECLGQGPNGDVLQIGAVAFDLNGGVQEPHELLQAEDRWFNVRLQTNGTADTSTMKFWSEQPEAWAAIKKLTVTEVPVALAAFDKFVESNLGKRGLVWSNPPGYDMRVLRNLYGRANMDPAWHPKHELCSRTLMWLARRVPEVNFRYPDMEGRGLVKHYALHDAAVQATTAQAAYRALVRTSAQAAYDAMIHSGGTAMNRTRFAEQIAPAKKKAARKAAKKKTPVKTY